MNWRFLGLLGLGLVTDVFGPSCEPEPSVMPTIAYVDSLQGFRFDVPEDWHVKRIEYEIVHYADVILSINNQDPDFQLPSSWTLASNPRKPVTYPHDWGRCLNPGMVHIVFAYEGGPGFWPPYYNKPHVDAFDEAVTKALQPSSRMTPGDVEIYNLHFSRWGRDWQIVVWMRKPYRAHTREQVVALLRSIRFRDTPIVSQDQAVGAAIRSLPAEDQLGQWPAVSARRCAFETNVHPDVNGYSVAFVKYADEQPDQIQGRWAFLVRADGSVQEVLLTSPNGALQPPAPREEHR